jgi:hypothetical protein
MLINGLPYNRESWLSNGSQQDHSEFRAADQVSPTRINEEEDQILENRLPGPVCH